MRSAWNVRVAGWIAPRRARTAAATMSASSPVVSIGVFGAGPDDGAGDGARVPLLAEREDDVGEVASRWRARRRRRRSGPARPCACRAARRAEREAALGLVELHRGDAEVEHDAVDRVVAARRATSSSSEKRSSTSVSRPLAARPDRRRARSQLVAVDADHAAAGARGSRAHSRRRRRCASM